VAAGLGLVLLLPRITADLVCGEHPGGGVPGRGRLRHPGADQLICSLLFLVAQWAFGSLSPRLNLFRDHPIVWRTYGLAIGIFVFSLTAMLAIGNHPEVPVILPAR
jgi:hypothetical protein